MGVDNRHYDVLDIRRHDDRNGHTVLVVDNWCDALVTSRLCGLSPCAMPS